MGGGPFMLLLQSGGVRFRVLIQSLLLATVTSVASGAPSVGAVRAPHIAPLWASYLFAVQAPWRALQLTPPCDSSGEARCSPLASGHDIVAVLPPEGSYAEPELTLPKMRMGGTLGGFVNMDVTEEPRLITGPELSWMTPDSPREDLLRLRVVASGWGVRYNWDEAHLSVGVAACTRFVMFGEDLPVVDVLTSEARIEFRLP